MDPTTAIVVSALGASVISAVASIAALVISQRREVREEHLRRAVDQHSEHYARIYRAARNLEVSIKDFGALNDAIADRSDPLLRQLLAIVRFEAHQFSREVDWRHNSGMFYLPMKLEQSCLALRTQLDTWLSIPRVHTGVLATVTDIDGTVSRVSFASRQSSPRLYRELRLENTRMVLDESAQSIAIRIDLERMLSSVIRDLKSVISY